jgi:hypothetical protein
MRETAREQRAIRLPVARPTNEEARHERCHRLQIALGNAVSDNVVRRRLRVSAPESHGAFAAFVIEASPTDHRHHGARYEQLARRVRAEGYDARVTINRSERRSAVTEVVVRLLDETGSTAVDALVPLLATHVRKSLLRRQDDRGRVVIYRPTGEVLRIVEIPPTR